MRIFYLTVTVLLIVAAGGYGLQAGDLYLNDGRIFYDYRIKEVKNNQVLIVFKRFDGMPDAAYVNISALPEKLQNEYGKKSSAKKSSRRAKTLRGALIIMAEQLGDDLGVLLPEERSMRRSLAECTRNMVQKVISQAGEKADLQVVAHNKSGVLVKVVGSSRGSKLRSGQYLYLQGDIANYKAFHCKIYPGGDKISFGSYGLVPMYGVNEETACTIALEFISKYIGDKNIFSSGNDEPYIEPQSVNIVDNSVYIIDNDRPYGIYDNRRRGKSSRKPSGNNHPDKPHKPRPDKTKPDKPDKPDNVAGSASPVTPGKNDGLNKTDRYPENSAASRQPSKRPVGKNIKNPQEYLKNQPVINKNYDNSDNYGLLPEWLRPAENNKK